MLAPGLVLYLGTGASAVRHVHHAVQLVWLAEGELEVTLAVGTVKARAAIVPARMPHAFASPPEPLALLLVDAHGARGAALDRRARSLVGEDLAGELAAIRFPGTDMTLPEIEAWLHALFTALGVESTEVDAPSRTTRRAIAYIERTVDGVPRLTDAAAFASTSSSRLSHRFTSEIGLPFRRFVLWTRMKRAVEAMRGGGDLTTAAVAAGFSDAAHLSRTFKAMFGLSPSVVLPFVEVTGRPWQERSSAQ